MVKNDKKNFVPPKWGFQHTVPYDKWTFFLGHLLNKTRFGLVWCQLILHLLYCSVFSSISIPLNPVTRFLLTTIHWFVIGQPTCHHNLTMSQGELKINKAIQSCHRYSIFKESIIKMQVQIDLYKMIESVSINVN